MAALLDVSTISLETARRAVAATLEAARERGIAVCVAVVDRAGHLLSFDRMDGAPLLCGQLAQDKAHTVAVFGLPTHEWWDLVRDEPALLHGLVKTERLVVFGGGVRIAAGDTLVGAIGVSGGSADEDRELADAGARACADLFTT